MLDNIKKDFPVFENNPWLVFLDNAASVQKPWYVIDGVGDYLASSYANIHRWSYQLSALSEELYHTSKHKIKKMLWARSSRLVYTYNASYAYNILVQSLVSSKKISSWDKVLLSSSEHHANIVPWLEAQKHVDFDIEYITKDENYNICISDLEDKYDESVKVVSLTWMSNVTWSFLDLGKVSDIINSENTIYILDGSQYVPHRPVDFDEIGCDFLIFTGHKIMANTGIWVLIWKKDIFDNLESTIWWGGSIQEVYKDKYSQAVLPNRFEVGTPNLTGAVSLLKAFEYIESVGGFENIWKHEKEMTAYALKKAQDFLKDYPQVSLIGSDSLEDRGFVFSFYVDGIHPDDIGMCMAEQNIAVRAWRHCAHVLMRECGLDKGTIRMSWYLYNDKTDIDKFFVEFGKSIDKLS